MKRILIVKVTSLGDIVETQPVVSDLRRAFPSAKIDWAADAAFADIIRWNPAVDRVVSTPLHRFKKTRSWANLKGIAASVCHLRAEKYDAVLDIHGVYKSAIISFLARGRRRYGYKNKDLGEVGAAFAYHSRFGPRPLTNAWRGMRMSVAEALGYTFDETPDFNLHLPQSAVPLALRQGESIAMLFHATSAEKKKWPIALWAATGRSLTARGYVVALPWGTDIERREAQQIAALVPGAIVLPKLSVTECAHCIDASALVVGMDTGLVHLAHALGRRTVMIFTATSREHFGIGAPGRSVSVGDRHAPPDVATVLKAIKSVLAGAIAPSMGRAASGAVG